MELLFPELEQDLKPRLEGMLFDIPDLTEDIRNGMDCCHNCKNTDRCSVYTFIREVERTDNIKLIVPECYRSLYEKYD